jgi:hypothetical protein
MNNVRVRKNRYIGKNTSKTTKKRLMRSKCMRVSVAAKARTQRSKQRNKTKRTLFPSKPSQRLTPCRTVGIDEMGYKHQCHVNKKRKNKTRKAATLILDHQDEAGEQTKEKESRT